MNGGPANRYAASSRPASAEGWALQRLTAPSRRFDVNGLQTGSDERTYIAQATDSQISALDLATEVMAGRVSVRAAKGATRVLRDDVPSAIGFTVHDGTILVTESGSGRVVRITPSGAETVVDGRVTG